MSTTIATSRRTTATTVPRQESIGVSILPKETSEAGPAFTFIQLDTSAPAPSATSDDIGGSSPGATTPARPTATCSRDDECGSDKVCSKGTCASLMGAAPLGPSGGSDHAPTTHMSTGVALAVGLAAVAAIILLIGAAFCLVRRKRRKTFDQSIEAPPVNRNRSASSATDQKTLVASVPNSPRNGLFGGQQEEMSPEVFAKLHSYGNEQEKYAHERHDSSSSAMGRQPVSTEKALPLAPTDMPLPPEPVEEKRYAINVSINKSMIFDDISFVAATQRDSYRDSNTSREKMPKYRFEEYLPPVTRTPRLSISQKTRSSRRISDYEMGPYPRKVSVSDEANSGDDEDAESISREETLQRLESKAPQLPMPELPPPSPSFSFRSYDWYQDIIGTERSDTEDNSPSVPARNPARTPTKATFGATITSSPQDLRASLVPGPLSGSASPAPTRNSHLHPLSAAQPSPSPTSANFRLSPTVYVMPSKPTKAKSNRTSTRSSLTQKPSHMSRSWVPDDGLFLPEEGTHNSYTTFKRRQSDGGRPASYSPLL